MQYILPHPDGKPLSPKLCMHLYQQDGFSEFTGATEEKQILAMQTYLQNGVHPDVWWMDAGWYVNRDHNWCDLGTWKADPARFPHGLKPIGDFCRANDMEFLLWFEPERASRGSEIFEQHPEWMLFWNDSPNPEQGMPFLGDPACLSFLLERINAILKESGVCVYRQDYNHGADIRFWEYNEPQDRVGALENLHVQGYYRLWDGILAANPGLWIDSCAGGGRRNDLETMRRSVPLHYTDVGYGNHPVKQKQHRQMFEWIPYFRAHNMAWDDADGVYHRDGANVHGYDEFSYQAAMAPALTSMLDYRAGEAEYAMARKMHPVWRQAAELMLRGDYWPLSECRKSPEDYYAMCFFDPDAGDGFVQILRNTQAEADVFSVRLSMLETDAVYQFINPVNGETFSMDLSQTDELTVRLEKRSAVLYMFSRVQ